MFKDGSPLRGRRLSPLGEAVRIGQREFSRKLRKEYRAGPHIGMELIFEEMKYSDGNPRDDAARVSAEHALARARADALKQSRKGGEGRAGLNSYVKRAVIFENRDLFDEVRLGKRSANSAAQVLRRRLTKGSDGGWIPSVRTLNDWFAECRRI